jgi:hypothetical protein
MGRAYALDHTSRSHGVGDACLQCATGDDMPQITVECDQGLGYLRANPGKHYLGLYKRCCHQPPR